MDPNELRRRLLAAEKSLRKAIDLLNEAFPEEASERAVVGQCSLCGKAIYSTDSVIRGRHEKCYVQLYNEEVRTGNETLESLESKGLIGPKGNPGRKPRAKKPPAAKSAAVKDILNQAEALKSKRKKAD